MLTQIIVNNQGVLAIITEIFAHGRARVGGKILQAGRVAGARGNNDGLVHDALALEPLDDTGDFAELLADSHVNVNDAGGLTVLVDHGVDGHGCFARLAVANNQLALAAADRHHGVNGQQSGHQRLMHAFAIQHARSGAFHQADVPGVDRAFIVQRAA